MSVSDAKYDKYPKPGKYLACVKVVDVFGCDMSITVKVDTKAATSPSRSSTTGSKSEAPGDSRSV